MAHILKGNNFLTDLFLCEFFANDVFIFSVVRAVCTSIDAVVGKIKRGKQYDTIAVDMLFNLFGGCKNFVV